MLALHHAAPAASPALVIVITLAAGLVAFWRPLLRLLLAIAVVTIVALLVSGAAVILNYTHHLR